MDKESVKECINKAIEAINTAGHFNPSTYHQVARENLWKALKELDNEEKNS